MRRAGTCSAAFTTTPRRETNRMSIAKRMKNVWTMLLGRDDQGVPWGQTRPGRAGRACVRPSRRPAPAWSPQSEPVARLRRHIGGAPRRASAARKCGLQGYAGRMIGDPHPIADRLTVPQGRLELPRLGRRHQHPFLEPANRRNQLDVIDVALFVDGHVEIARIVSPAPAARGSCWRLRRGGSTSVIRTRIRGEGSRVRRSGAGCRSCNGVRLWR